MAQILSRNVFRKEKVLQIGRKCGGSAHKTGHNGGLSLIKSGNIPIRKVSVNDEFNELKSVIVGLTDTDYRYPMENEDITFEYTRVLNEDAEFSNFDKLVTESIPGRGYGMMPLDLINKENEMLDNVADKLSSLGINVYRPLNRAQQGKNNNINYDFVENEHFKAQCYMQAHCPRDLILVVGNKVILCPTILRGRRSEIDYFYSDILDNMVQHGDESGVEIIDLRKHSPLCDKNTKNELNDLINKFVNNTDALMDEKDVSFPFFDAANILKLGKNRLLFQISSSGNMLGCQLLQSVLGDEYEILPVKGIYNANHIDSTFSFLNDKTVLFNPDRCNYDKCESLLKPFGFNKFIQCPHDIFDIGYQYTNKSSKWIAMNLLMINPQLVMIEENQKSLMNLLKSECNINSLPVKLPYARDFGGGCHCVTLDLLRE